MTLADRRWFWIWAVNAAVTSAILVWAITTIARLPPPAPPALAPIIVPTPAPALPRDRTADYQCGYLAGRMSIVKQLRLKDEVLGFDGCPDAPSSGELARK
jgi:hypothetical protein